MYVDPMVAKAVVLALAVAIAMNIAIVTAVLARISGAHPAQAAIKAGTAFGGTLALAVALLTALGVV
jgi:VIT1/CCC1 family predicted Fe2+/Mn2+ transporter